MKIFPEVPPLDSGAVVEPARDLDCAVEVADPALGVDHREEAGGGVEDGLEEAVLRAELGLQALLLEGERGRRRHGVHELALVGEAPVMEERCDALAAVLDERRSVPGPRDRLGERLALVVDPRLTLRGPVGQVQRRVAERRRQRVAERAAVAEGDHEVRDACAGESRPQDAGEERDRHEREGSQRGELDRVAGVGVEGADEAARHETHERDQGEEIHRPDDAPERRRCLLVALDESHEDERRQRRGAQRDGDVDHLCEPGAVGYEERALGAVVASPDRRWIDERHDEGADRDEREDSPDDPLVAGAKPSGRVGEDEVRERDERDAAEDVPEREEQRAARELQRAERPEKPDGEHLGPRAVVRPAQSRHHARHREDQPRDGDHRDQRPRLAEVRRHDEVQRDAVQRHAEPDCGGEPAAGHRSRKRTAAPVSSALAMNPRAPLVRIRPL